MKKLVLAGLALILSFSFAQNDPSSYYIDLSNPEDLVNPNDYYEYMIIKGDYLWFISDQFYGDPLKWTKIYEANPYIINPDWIYPNNWLVIPHIFADENGKPVTGSATDKASIEEEETTSTHPQETEVSSVAISDVETETTEKTAASSDTEMATTTDLTKMTEEKTKRGHKQKDCNCPDSCECKHSYCGKPGWSLGLHAGFPLGSAPEDESLNVGLLLGTPLGVRLGALQVGFGAGVFTYNFEDVYLGGGMLASLCLNDLFKLKSPLKLQLHGAGFYVFGEESGPGFGLIGSGSLPISDSPFNIGLYGGLGKYYPGDNDYDWGNVGAVLFYKF